jgi:hypothetical protein
MNAILEHTPRDGMLDYWIILDVQPHKDEELLVQLQFVWKAKELPEDARCRVAVAALAALRRELHEAGL